MPLFDYHCRACAHDFERLVSAREEPVCPGCGSNQLDKRMSVPAGPGKSKAVIASARRQAAREGHFSNFSRSEKPRC
jgi:putative FmdB family regulatory protein